MYLTENNYVKFITVAPKKQMERNLTKFFNNVFTCNALAYKIKL